MERVEMNCNRGSALSLFLAGLGAGIALTFLLAPLSGAATRNLIGRKVKRGEDWIREKAAAAEDFAVTQGAGLRDRVKEVAAVVGRS